MKAAELIVGVDYLSTTDKDWGRDVPGWPSKKRVRIIEAGVPYWRMYWSWGESYPDKDGKVDHSGPKKAALVHVIDKETGEVIKRDRVLLSTIRATWTEFEDARAAAGVRQDAKADVYKAHSLRAAELNLHLEGKGVRIEWKANRDFHGRISGGQWALIGTYGTAGATKLMNYIEEALDAN